MNATDKRILDFHFANLEYANGAPLSLTSFKHWDMDSEHEFEGNHMMGVFLIPLDTNGRAQLQ